MRWNQRAKKGTFMRKRQQYRPATTAIESLEYRAYLSAVYTAVNLSRLVANASDRVVAGVQMTNSGLIALNVGEVAGETESPDSYIYSLAGHHLYAGLDGQEIDGVDNAGDAVYDNFIGDALIDFQGQTHTVSIANTDTDTYEYMPGSINDEGQVAVTLEHVHMPPPDLTGAYTAWVPEVLNSSGVPVADVNSDEDTAPQLAAVHLNDAGLMTFSDGQQAAVLNANTSDVTVIGDDFKSGSTSEATGINQSGVVVGIYSHGRSVKGFFSFDTASDALTTVAVPPDETPIAAAISDNGTVVGTIQETARVRRHVRSVNQAVLISMNGGIEDLTSMTTLPVGASLVSAASVNDSGEILTECESANGTELAFLLTPNA
jgi:hypothetical protein